MDETMRATNDCSYESSISEAKRYAREGILEAYPTALEISEPQEGMYEFEATRFDSEQLPPVARSKLLEMRCQSGVESPEWWWDVLIGEGDLLYKELENI